MYLPWRQADPNVGCPDGTYNEVRADENGELTEWPKVHDWKSCVATQIATEGSNPSLSADRPRRVCGQ
jgi:hypothetical protein